MKQPTTLSEFIEREMLGKDYLLREKCNKGEEKASRRRADKGFGN